jgi:hypothetical protein
VIEYETKSSYLIGNDPLSLAALASSPKGRAFVLH